MSATKHSKVGATPPFYFSAINCVQLNYAQNARGCVSVSSSNAHTAFFAPLCTLHNPGDEFLCKMPIKKVPKPLDLSPGLWYYNIVRRGRAQIPEARWKPSRETGEAHWVGTVEQIKRSECIIHTPYKFAHPVRLGLSVKRYTDGSP